MQEGSVQAHQPFGIRQRVSSSCGPTDRIDWRRHAVTWLQRTRESICEFSRAFEVRETDTWVIRAVYEQLQQQLR